jgi:hypothetical protein
MTVPGPSDLAATQALITGLDEYIRARFGLIAVQTFEEQRFLRLMDGLVHDARHAAKGLYVWSRTRGLRLVGGPGAGPQPKPIAGRDDPTAVLEYVEQAERGLFVLCDFAPYLVGYGTPDPVMVRRLRDLAWDIRGKAVTLLFVGAQWPEVPDLEKEVKVLDLPLPEEGETAAILDQQVARLADNEINVILDGAGRDTLVQALLGLTAQEQETVLAKAVVRQRALGPDSARLVLDEKRDLVRRIGALTFTPPGRPEEMGGYAPIRRLLERAARTFTPAARAFGLDEAKGLLLIGLPGCGKDSWVRAASAIMGRALFNLDLGAAMGAGGGLLGSAELSIKRALEMATLTRGILALSEYEKTVSGLQSSARSDAGVTSRVVASLLAWLADPHPGVFVIATANDVRDLAPEQVRQGRFTPVFVDLPTGLDRQAIFAAHLAKRGRTPGDFDLERLAEHSDGYSGAEIEEAVNGGLLEAFEDGARRLRTEDLVAALRGIRPISQVKAAEVEDLRRWAREALAIDANRGVTVGQQTDGDGLAVEF